MVSLTINLDDETVKRLETAAKERGTTVDELLAAGAYLVLHQPDYELTEEEEAQLEAAEAEIDRGEFVTHEELMKKLQALRR